jgi:hypothetical protein
MNQYNKSMRKLSLVRPLLTVAAVLAPFEYAHAYVGPGLGLGTIMVILGFLGSLLLAVFGIFWYPIKRALKKRKAAAQAESAQIREVSASPAEQEATYP